MDPLSPLCQFCLTGGCATQERGVIVGLCQITAWPISPENSVFKFALEWWRRWPREQAAARAPVNLIYVVDIARYGKARLQEPGLKDPEIQKSYYNVATGLIAGNVYLFAASQGLAAWFHNCNKAALAEELKLRPEQHVLYAQTVGYPANK